MSEWKKTRLGEIAESVTYGYTDSATTEKVGPHFLRITDIVPDQIDWQSVPYCRASEKDFEKYQLKIGDIVIARTGATVGYAKFIRQDVKAVNASYLVKIRIDASKANPFFVGYCVESKAYKQYVMRNVNGAAQPNASAPVLAGFELPLPPRHIQDRIARILSDYDSAIANCRKQIALLEEAAMRLYREWFKDGKGEKKRFDDIASVCSGKRPPMKSSVLTKECYVPLFGASEMMGYTSDALYSEPILITGRVGTHGIVQRVVEPCWPSDNTLVVKSPYIAFAYQFMKHIDYASMNRGVAQPLLTQSDLKDVALRMPEEKLLLKYESVAGEMLGQVDALNKQIRTLTEARDRLLPKLMKGEVTV